jgi:hypothetical protein
MERTIDGMLGTAQTAKIFRVRVTTKIPGKLWNGEQKGIPVGVEFNVFNQDETHFYVQNDARNYTAELKKGYFEVI